MPFHLFIDSAIRHIIQYTLGDKAEDHLAQAAWNLFSLMHLEITHSEFNDMPACEVKIEILAKYPELAAIFNIEKIQADNGKSSRPRTGEKNLGR